MQAQLARISLSAEIFSIAYSDVYLCHTPGTPPCHALHFPDHTEKDQKMSMIKSYAAKEAGGDWKFMSTIPVN